MKLQLIINGEKTIIDCTTSDEIIHTSKGESPVTGFVGVVTDVIHVGEYVKLDFNTEIRQVTIKRNDFKDWMQVGARLKIDWFSSISIELIAAPPKFS